MRAVRLLAYTSAFLLVLGTSMAQAQASRTWVSGVGDDANLQPRSVQDICRRYLGAPAGR